jgi:hypothetical protein
VESFSKQKNWEPFAHPVAKNPVRLEFGSS